MLLKVVILVGGETTGTRFRPLSMDVPKVLFPIAGKPLISHIIDNIVSQVEDQLSEILLLGFFKDTSKFDEYLETTKGIYPDLKIRYLSEPYPMGTGGGLQYFKNEIASKSDPHGKVMIIHGDIVTIYPFKKMLDFYESKKANSIILGIDPLILMNNSQNTVQVQNQNSYKTYEKDKLLSNYGTIIANKETSEVVHYVEKPSSKLSKFQTIASYDTFISGGIYLFNDIFFKLLDEAQKEKSSKLNHFSMDDIDDDTVDANILSLELDVLKILASEKQGKFYTLKSNSFWYQLKTPVSALLANSFFLERCLQSEFKSELMQPSINIYPPVKIWGSDLPGAQGYKIGPNVSIGRKVKIGSGTRLKNCIIGDNVSIGDNTFIANAIISKGVKIGKWCRIEGTMDNSTISKDLTRVKSDGYFKIINNIVVLCENTTVCNQVFVYNSIVLPHKELKNDIKYEIVM
ncbi:uncharacterized protein PRCAT00006140001 [Priceomyces carsonii]|uniref:uncharacterized protein n=1 Tax=Priceomyces carsonii TaxID=28549 RepID=UPI002ED9F603|nr:unnamed protein product [Priceomyces carsonii]